MSDTPPVVVVEIPQIVREMLVIEKLAKEILGPREIHEIETMGLKFVRRPADGSWQSKETFFLCSLKPTPENQETLFDAMVNKGVRWVMVTREYIICYKRRHGTLFQEELPKILNTMSNAWRQSPYYH